MNKINEVLYQEEIWIKHRARVNWLKSGDRNAAYFHAYAAQRKRISGIHILQREYGSVCDNADEIKNEVQNFYSDLYSSDGFPNFQQVLDLVEEKVTLQDRVLLEEDFSTDEVKKALFQMHPSKALGVDGFTARFYQRHWHLFGEDLCKAVLSFLNGGDMSAKMNDTTITLIPKVRNP
jgi:hypothetical protein